MGLVAVAFALTFGCGRVGYDPQPSLDAGPGGGDAGDPSSDAGGSLDAGSRDAGTDAGPPECPTEMAEIAGWSSRVCIDTVQSGDLTWVEGSAFCADQGKRFCTDAEWFEGCNQHSGTASLDMIDDWEWVADLITPTEAGKRGGSGACDTTSSHQIDTDPYGVRCCLDL